MAKQLEKISYIILSYMVLPIDGTSSQGTEEICGSASYAFVQLLLIHFFGLYSRFQNGIGHIMMGSFMGRGIRYIRLVKVLYCKLPTIGRKLPSFPHRDLNCRPQRWEASSFVQHPSCKISGAYLVGLY